MLEAFSTYHKKLQIETKKIDVSPADTNKSVIQSRNMVAFLNNLAFDVNEKDITDFFKGKSINDIEIVKNARGISRGFAFVEFSDLNDLSEALDMKTGIINGREFTISKSKREITHKKNQLHNVLSKKDAVDSKIQEEKKEENKKEEKMKSNDEFRKLLFK